jgi:hypothetical protein
MTSFIACKFIEAPETSSKAISGIPSEYSSKKSLKFRYEYTNIIKYKYISIIYFI